MSRYDWLVGKIGKLMRCPPKEDEFFGVGEGDDYLREPALECSFRIGDDGSQSIGCLLVAQSRRPGFGCETIPLFSFTRKSGRRGWHLKCDERLISHWLWQELVNLERRDSLPPLSEAEQDLILEDNLNQL